MLKSTRPTPEITITGAMDACKIRIGSAMGVPTNDPYEKASEPLNDTARQRNP
jgi:hypothetical protein